MITKEQFINFLNAFKSFEQSVDRFDCAITGKSYSTILFETDWYEANGKMLDIFLDSHFTEEGKDLVYWWLFESVDKVIYEKLQQLNFFDEFKEGEDRVISVRTIDELWNYMKKNKESYIL